MSHQLTHGLAQEPPVADQIVGVARLDQLDLRGDPRERRIEVAGLRLAVAARIALGGGPVVAKRRLGILQRELVDQFVHPRIVRVVADQHPQTLLRPVLVEHREHGALQQLQRLAERGNDHRDPRLRAGGHGRAHRHRALPAVAHRHQQSGHHHGGGRQEGQRQPGVREVRVSHQPGQEPSDAENQQNAERLRPTVVVNRPAHLRFHSSTGPSHSSPAWPAPPPVPRGRGASSIPVPWGRGASLRQISIGSV